MLVIFICSKTANTCLRNYIATSGIIINCVLTDYWLNCSMENKFREWCSLIFLGCSYAGINNVLSTSGIPIQHPKSCLSSSRHFVVVFLIFHFLANSLNACPLIFKFLSEFWQILWSNNYILSPCRYPTNTWWARGVGTTENEIHK